MLSNSALYILIQDDLKNLKKELKEELMEDIRKELVSNKSKEIVEEQSQVKWSNASIAVEKEKVNR